MDPGCGASDIWLFTDINLGGVEICFYRDSNTNNFRADLTQYFWECHGAGSQCPFGGWIESYWAGVDEGCLNLSTLIFENPNFINFSPWQQNDDLVSTFQYPNTNILYLGPGAQCSDVIP